MHLTLDKRIGIHIPVHFVHRENSSAPDKRRNNETKTKDVNSKGQNEIASNDINTITGNKIDYAAAKNNTYKEERLDANELERTDIDDKLLIQGSRGKRRRRRDLSSEIAGERKDQRSDVVHKRQATTDTVYDWSVDELSDSEKWQVDRIDPARKVGTKHVYLTCYTQGMSAYGL